MLLAFEGGKVEWWDTVAKTVMARHNTDGGMNLMRCVAVDTVRREFVLGMVFAAPDTCESFPYGLFSFTSQSTHLRNRGHLMRLSVLRLVMSTGFSQRPSIVEYPSYPLTFPITGIFVGGEIVGLVGIVEATKSVALLLLNRDTSEMTCLDTGIEAVSFR